MGNIKYKNCGCPVTQPCTCPTPGDYEARIARVEIGVADIIKALTVAKLWPEDALEHVETTERNER